MSELNGRTTGWSGNVDKKFLCLEDCDEGINGFEALESVFRGMDLQKVKV